MAKTDKNQKLTDKQQRFADVFMGNATQAAIDAGYSEKTAEVQGSRLLRNVKVLEAIKNRQMERKTSTIASREEIQQFWTDVMTGLESEDMKDRLKASELLAKSEGYFLDRHEVTGKDGAPIELKSMSLREIEAQIKELEAELEE